MSRHEAIWSDGKTTVQGTWEYYRPSDKFIIWLDSKDPVTGRQRVVETHGDVPEWGKWKRVP